MQSLSVENLAIELGGSQIVHDIQFSLQSGEIGCLLGASGCGKTTILRAIAGFERLQRGSIHIGSKPVANAHSCLPVEMRNVGMVFQDFALFPHLTVFQNILFALKKNSQSAQKRVHELLELVDLSNRAKHYPHELSGGQQQRVALARALAPKPAILLLDEPFSSIDNELRDSLATKVRDVLNSEKVTGLLVTHNQQEAFAMADYIGIMREGALEQWDTPLALYHLPITPYVAQFLGEGNFIAAEVTGKHRVKTALGEFENTETDLSALMGKPAKIYVRPDDIMHDDQSPYQLPIVEKQFKGATFTYKLALHDGSHVLCLASSHHDHKLKNPMGVRLELAHLLVFAA